MFQSKILGNMFLKKIKFKHFSIHCILYYIYNYKKKVQVIKMKISITMIKCFLFSPNVISSTKYDKKHMIKIPFRCKTLDLHDIVNFSLHGSYTRVK